MVFRRVFLARFLDGTCLGYGIFLVGMFFPSWELGFNQALVSLSLGFILAEIVARLRILTLGEVLFAPKGKRIAERAQTWVLTPWGLQLNFIFWLSLYWAVVLIRPEAQVLARPERLELGSRIWNEMLHPQLSVLSLAGPALVQTIFMAIVATVAAIPIAFVLSFLFSRRIMSGHVLGLFINMFVRFIFNMARSVEPLLWVLVIAIWLGEGPFAGVLALLVQSVASLAKQFSRVIEESASAVRESVESTGAGALQVVYFAVIPEIIVPVVSHSISRWLFNLKTATIIGLIGGGGVGSLLLQLQKKEAWGEIATLIVLTAACVWILDYFSSAIRDSLE